jgi:hypothetical protein
VNNSLSDVGMLNLSAFCKGQDCSGFGRRVLIETFKKSEAPLVYDYLRLTFDEKMQLNDNMK